MKIFGVLSLIVCLSSFAAEKPTYPFDGIPVDAANGIRKFAEITRKQVKESRDAHAKTHGCVSGVTLKIRKNLPAHLQAGFFQPDTELQGIARVSAGPGNPALSDHTPGPSGLALKFLLGKELQKKLIPVPNENRHFVDAKFYKSFDIVTIGRVREFFVNTGADYGPFFAAEGAAGAAIKAGKTPAEAAEIFRKLYVDPEKGPKRILEGKLREVLGKVQVKNPLLETYNTWLPSSLGANFIKYEIAPCKDSNPDNYNVPKEIGDWQKDPNFIAKILKHELVAAPTCFKLNVQVHTKGMPSIDSAAQPWSTELSPYEEIGEITIPQKSVGKELMNDELCERMSFHPGHAPKDHYPVGSVNLVRVGGIDTDRKAFEGVYTAVHEQRNLNRIEKEKQKNKNP